MKLYPWNYVQTIGRRIIIDLKDRSYLTLRLWTDHCEYIVAQRIRRGQQVIAFYDRIWGEKAFRDLLKGLRRHVQRHIKGVMLSSVGVYAFDWESNRIHNDILKSYFHEIDFVEKLRKATLICSVCAKRKIVSEKIEGIDYCKCIKSSNYNSVNKNIKNSDLKKCLNDNDINEINEWKPYLEKEGMIIWRKEEKPSLYAYKVYAKYPDITAEDFLQVQTDIDYRKKWDDTALALEVIDVDPEDVGKSQVIYWEMRWPKLFANRDYVYTRRYITDAKRKLIVICNKSTNHPKCPINPNKQRVNEYWSYMVIKPFHSFQEPGLEFVLTYFDDPGLAIPSTITSWVAQKQMPEFLYKLYFATKEYAEHKRKEMHKILSRSWNSYRIPTKETVNTELEPKHHPFRKVKINREEYQNEKAEEINRIKYKNDNETDNSCDNEKHTAIEDHVENSTTAEIEQQEKKSWWSYLRPYYYFA